MVVQSHVVLLRSRSAGPTDSQAHARESDERHNR